MTRTRALAVVFAAATCLFAACSSPTDLPLGLPDLDGTIQEVHASPQSVLVKGNAACAFQLDIGANTRLLRREADGSRVKASFADFTVGAHVQVWTQGVIVTTCPEQDLEYALLLLP